MRPGLVRSAVGLALLLALPIAAPAAAQIGTPTEADLREGRAQISASESRSVAQVSGPVDAATYVLGPGDVLRLIFSGPFTRLITAEIGPEGSMLVPDYGPVRVGGMTLTAARAEVRRRVGAGMRRDVHLDLELARVRLLRVFLAGDVTEPGAV
ncbi:MAG: polysaccharide biosynthesis/export family protein, partial [Candidatus Eisenbacteria bacterium]